MALEIDVQPTFRPASPAAIADSAFEVFRAGMGTLLGLSVLANVPVFAALAGLWLFVRDYGHNWGSAVYFVPLAALSIAIAIGCWLRAVGTGALAHASLVSLSGRAPSVTESLSAAFSMGAALGVVSVLRTGLALIGLLMCIFPGLIFFEALALAPHAVMLEKLAPSNAMIRSAGLFPRAAGGLFATTLLGLTGYVLCVIEILLFIRIAAMLAGLVLPVDGTALFARPELPWITLALAKIVVDPLVSAAAAVAWMDARIRADGLDLELRAQRLGGERLATDPEPA